MQEEEGMKKGWLTEVYEGICKIEKDAERHYRENLFEDAGNGMIRIRRDRLRVHKPNNNNIQPETTKSPKQH
jgi:hypothetical protein